MSLTLHLGSTKAATSTGVAPSNGPAGLNGSTGSTAAKAGILGLLCVIGCAAVPLAIGGFGALSGAIAGEAWIIALVLPIAVGFYLFRRRTGRNIC